METLHDVRDFVSGLHHAVTSQQRYCLLNHLILNFQASFDPVGLSQALVKDGFIHGLVLQLGFVLSSRPHDVELISQALALVYRHCPEPVMEVSVQDAPDLMPLLVRALLLDQPHHHLQQQQRLHPQGSHASNSNQLVHAIFSVWHSWSSSAKLSFFLLRERGSFALLPAIVQVLHQRRRQLRHDEQVELLGCLKNLSYYAEEEQRREMVQHSGFLPLLIKLSSETCLQPCDWDNTGDDETTGKIPERLSAVFRNLAVQPNTRQLLAQQPDFVGALLRLATNVSEQQDRHIVVLRNVLNTLQSLALEDESCLALVLYGDGMILGLLHRLLRNHNPQQHQHHRPHNDFHDHPRQDSDDTTIRKRASRVARLLCSSSSALPMIVHHVGLLETLLSHALQDTNRQVRMDATKAFCQCTSVLQASLHPHLENVLNGLAHLLELGRPIVADDYTTRDRPEELEAIMLVARACREQSNNPYNRAALVHQRILMERLANIAMMSSATPPWSMDFDLDQPYIPFRNSSSVREDIVYTFYQLSTEASIQANVTAIPAVIKALVWNAQSPGTTTNATTAATATDGAPRAAAERTLPAEQRRKRDYAIAALVQLASNDMNRATLVSYSGLLPVLIHFAATAHQQQQPPNQPAQQRRQPRQQQQHQRPPMVEANTTSSHANKASVKSTIMQLVAVL